MGSSAASYYMKIKERNCRQPDADLRRQSKSEKQSERRVKG